MRSDRSPLLLPVLYVAAFIAGFNENIMNVALVDIMAEFDVPAPTAQWLVTGYMMVTTVVVAISAYLYRRLGLRKLFFWAVAFLALGSIAAVFARSFVVLLACRLVQAVGIGIFIPAMMSTVLMVAPRKKLGFYLALGGMMITFGPACGPVVSGLMVTVFGWHTIFLPTLAVVLVLGAFAVVAVHDTVETEALRLDIPSLILLVLGLVGFVYGLSEITIQPAVAAATLLLGAAVLAVFARRQFVVQNPVLNLLPMTSSRFWPSAILVVVAMMTTFSLSVLLPLYFQGSLGMTALAAGALLLAPILVNAATAIVGGKVMDSRGPWPLLAVGFAVIVVGQLGISVFAPHLSWLGVLGASVLSFGGVGLVLSPSQTAGLSTLSEPEYPHGVVLLNTFVQVAAAIGPSLLIGILSSGASSRENEGASAAQANADGFALAILVAAVIAVVGAIVAVFYSRMLAAGEGQTEEPTKLTIASLMRTEVFSVPTIATVEDVVAQFLSTKTAGLPVVDGEGHACGYITNGDVLRAVAGRDDSPVDLAFGLNVHPWDPEMSERVARVMQLGVMDLAARNVVTANVEDTVEDVAALLGSRPIYKVPVLSGDVVVGVITRGDLVRSIFGSFTGSGAKRD